MTDATEAFRTARDLLLELREDHDEARARFDVVAAGPAGDREALVVLGPDADEQRLTFADLAGRSRRLAGWLEAQGVRRGDRVLLMLGNQVELWETVLAAIRLGAVLIPATTLLAAADVRDRIDRGRVRHVVARSADIRVFEG